MYIFLTIVAVAILAPYVLGPIAIKLALKIRSRPPLEGIGVDALPPEAYEYFGWTAPAMGVCGFQLAAYLRVADQVPNVTGYIALWVNRSTGQAATVVVIFSKAGNKETAKRYTEFQTKPVPGVAVLTNNTDELHSFKIDARVKDVAVLPQVEDIATLYQVHLCREARLVRADSPRYVPPAGHEVKFLGDAVAHDVENQVMLGRLYCVDDDIHQPTWPGALVMTWGQLFPVKQFRRAAQRRAAERELAQMRQMPFPKNVRITEQSPYGNG